MFIKVFPELATLSCQRQVFGLSQIYIILHSVSEAFLHLATVFCFRHKCFLFEDFQTKSILRDSVGKNRIQISITLAFFLSLQPKPSKPGPCTTIRQADKVIAVFLKDRCLIYRLAWLCCGSLKVWWLAPWTQMKCTSHVGDIEFNARYKTVKGRMSRSATCVAPAWRVKRIKLQHGHYSTGHKRLYFSLLDDHYTKIEISFAISPGFRYMGKSANRQKKCCIFFFQRMRAEAKPF